MTQSWKWLLVHLCFVDDLFYTGGVGCELAQSKPQLLRRGTILNPNLAQGLPIHSPLRGS